MEAKTRDSRCCSSLRVSDLSEFFAVAEKDGHVMADVIGDRCLDCREWRDCSHVKSRFNSTDNSKRRVSTHLFWKRLLGVSFPVTDAMLQQHVWKKLPSCEFGIKANGQAKVTAKVCVNPHHYHPRKEREFVGLIDMLTTSLREMHLLPGDAALENIMNNAAHLPAEELFHAACSHIRQRLEDNQASSVEPLRRMVQADGPASLAPSHARTIRDGGGMRRACAPNQGLSALGSVSSLLHAATGIQETAAGPAVAAATRRDESSVAAALADLSGLADLATVAASHHKASIAQAEEDQRAAAGATACG